MARRQYPHTLRAICEALIFVLALILASSNALELFVDAVLSNMWSTAAFFIGMSAVLIHLYRKYIP